MAASTHDRFVFAMVMSCKDYLANNQGKVMSDFLQLDDTRQLFAEALATKVLTAAQAEMVLRVLHSECSGGRKAH